MVNNIKQSTKQAKIIYTVAAVIVVISALIKINHWPGNDFADLATKIGYIAGFGGVLWENINLKKELKKLTTTTDLKNSN